MLRVLKIPPQSNPDPRPIERDDLHALLDAAQGDDRLTAAILAMLNLCMYPIAVCMLEWKFIDRIKRTL